MDKFRSAENAYKSQKTFLEEHFVSEKTRLNKTLNEAQRQADDAFVKFQNASSEYATSNSSYQSLLTYPANTPYGELPTYSSDQGFLRVQTATNREQMAFMKFPTMQLKKDDVITEAHLKVYKFGGMGGPVRVDVASCQWSRGTLVYSRSLNMGFTRASRGVTAKIPEEEQTWVTIQLKGDVIQNARMAGDHVCLVVKGGPSDGPAILSSELVPDEAPTLNLDVKEAPTELKYNTGPIDANPVKKKPPKDERELCKERIKREITEELTKEQLDKNARSAATSAMNLQQTETLETDAKNVLAGAEMQTYSTEVAGNLISQQKSALETAAQNKVAQQLQQMAASGASIDAIAAATGQLASQAQADVAAAASKAANKIQQKIQAGLADAEENLKAQTDAAQQQMQSQEDKIKMKGSKLTAAQEAQIGAKVEVELAKRVGVCAAKGGSNVGESSSAIKGGKSSGAVELGDSEADELEYFDISEEVY